MSVILEGLQGANRRLRLVLEAIEDTGPAIRVTPEQLAALLEELLRVGEWLRSGAIRDPGPAVARELDEYRKHMERLRRLMPSVQACLLTERARLEADRAHLKAAAAWAGGSQSTT